MNICICLTGLARNFVETEAHIINETLSLPLHIASGIDISTHPHCQCHAAFDMSGHPRRPKFLPDDQNPVDDLIFQIQSSHFDTNVVVCQTATLFCKTMKCWHLF